jgi:hypothetical protein
MSMKTDDHGKRKLSGLFGEAEWGQKTRSYSGATIRLSSSQWKAITSEATIRSRTLPQDEANGEDAPDEDPRAVLEL